MRTHSFLLHLLPQTDTIITYPVMSPTHVLFDNSEPPSPGGHSIHTSAPSSLDNSPAHPVIGLEPATSRSPARRVLSPRLPTPMSNSLSPSPRALSLPSERSPLSSRPPPDIDASQGFSPASAYNTPLGGSVLPEDGRVPDDLHFVPSPRIQSPFSDIYSVDAHSSPEHVPSFGSPHAQSPSIGSDLTLDSDDEFDVLSPRSGIFSPPVRMNDDLFDVGSQHGSEGSWASVGGRRSPIDF